MRAQVAAIKRVCEAVDLPDDNHVGQSWPSHIYFEDVNGQSQFDLVEIIQNEVRTCPANRTLAPNEILVGMALGFQRLSDRHWQRPPPVS